jgi:hypothetical protein
MLAKQVTQARRVKLAHPERLVLRLAPQHPLQRGPRMVPEPAWKPERLLKV